MSNLEFSYAELSGFANAADGLKVPGFADDTGDDLQGDVIGGPQAAHEYTKLAMLAEYHLGRGRRGVAAFAKLSRDIAEHFGQRDQVNAEELNKVWSAEHLPMIANGKQDKPPQLPEYPEDRA
ncbi:hypothetical protein ACQHIV_26255 [Kribbella sp. GL6]|uniref:hypothetical protein n=1 Tax=Kribbella sp. GL6 TaxID=3419765 RepID=UPI003D0839F8